MSHGIIFEKLNQIPSATCTTAEDSKSLTPRHLGKMVVMSESIVIPPNRFENGDIINLFNTTASGIQVIPGGGVTLKWVGSGASGTRTVGAYSQASLWFETANIAWITGGALT